MSSVEVPTKPTDPISTPAAPKVEPPRPSLPASSLPSNTTLNRKPEPNVDATKSAAAPGMRPVPATVLKQAPAPAPRAAPKNSHVVVAATIIHPAPGASAQVAAAARAAALSAAKAAANAGKPGNPAALHGHMLGRAQMQHGAAALNAKQAKQAADSILNAKKKRTQDLAKSLGFPVQNGGKKKGSRKKKKGAHGSDDGGSSSEEDAESLRKKIKWNMEPHLSIMRKAVEAALTGKSTTKIADEYNIPARTLRRYVANEKRDADHPKLLKTVDLGLSRLARTGKGSPGKGSATADGKKKTSMRGKAGKKKAGADAKLKKGDGKKKKGASPYPGAAVAAQIQKKGKPVPTASGSSIHHQMMLNYTAAPPALGMGDRTSSGGRMRANSFEMLLKAYEFEYMMNQTGTTSNGSTAAANTAGAKTGASVKTEGKSVEGDSASGSYDKHLTAGNMMFDNTMGDPSWPRRRTRTNSLDLLLNAAKLDTSSDDVKPVATKTGMMLAPTNKAKAGSAAVKKEDSKGKGKGAAATTVDGKLRLPTSSVGSVDELAAVSNSTNAAITGGASLADVTDVKEGATLVRNRMSSFDSESAWARSRTLSGDPYMPSGSIGGLRDRRASSIDMFDPFMASGDGVPVRRNRFESGSLDLLIQVCDEKSGPDGVRTRGGPAMSIGSMPSFGSISDLAAMSFTSGKSRNNSMAIPEGKADAMALAGLLESTKTGNSSGTNKRKGGPAAKGAKKGRTSGGAAAAGKGNGDADAKKKGGGLKFKMSTRQSPTGSKEGKKKGNGTTKRGRTPNNNPGHALDVGGWNQ